MIKTIFALAVLFAACTHQEKTVIKTTKTSSIFNFDSNGKQTGKTLYYYSGKLLDSMCIYDTAKVLTVVYKYKSPRQRISKQIMHPSRNVIQGYGLDSLNENGDVIEYRSFDKDGNLSNWYKMDYTYK